MNLDGRSALITGASQGLGRAIAEHFVRAGASVLLTARGAGLLEQTRDELSALARPGRQVLALQADVGHPDDCRKSVKHAVASLPNLCILVNNAGIYGPMGALDEIDWGDWVDAFRINLLGTALMCREAIPHFRSLKYGKIINLSGGGAGALPRISAYAASKAAVVRLTETLAEELKECHVDVNAVAPGALNTRLLDEVLSAGPQRVGRDFYERSLKQRDGGGAGLRKGAALAAFLASAQSDGITGRLLSAVWDDWANLPSWREELAKGDVYTLRRITPEDRGEGQEMRIGIVGCGLIGQKRAKSLGQNPLVAVADVNPDRSAALAKQYPGCESVGEWRELVARRDVDVVIVSTTNDSLAAVTLAAVVAGKHVLVEKPAARDAAELAPVIEAARKAGRVVKVGFNHRFHPAFKSARKLVDEGAVGPLLYVRARYGHGGRLGYDREWRADPAIAGGGELLDQGVHLIDLTRWFLGDVCEVRGEIGTFFWDMPVEDNGFLCLKHAGGRLAWLHASCTEWKNLFCFEVFGKTGKLQIDGLGGSYGVERLSHYRMLPQMGPPETTIWEYPGEDRSWHDEFAQFASTVKGGGRVWGDLTDARAALEVVGKVYAEAAGPLKLAG